MHHYYLHEGGAAKGPYTLDALRIQPPAADTPVWREGMADWKKAGEVEELRDIVISTGQLHRSEKKSRPLLWLLLLLPVIGLSAYLLTEKKDPSTPAKTIPPVKKEVPKQQEVKLTAEDSAVLREIALKQEIKRNLYQYVQAKASRYRKGTFGGVSDLTITVYNATPYLLNEVLVEVDYIKENGERFKKETLSFKNIKGNSLLEMEAPESRRGTSVTYTISKIRSSALDR